ncbi:FtsK/SpoIIIE domain-containing protein [Dactylosporangium sp. McL0621]|uniref:FtsK/SpoIIIE domain-containing protein n=1 Tax=Dactylosporangium sp. McL0621 TaxID=3415678 RepID=UPI003CEE4944
MTPPEPHRRPVHRRPRLLKARPAATAYDLPAVPAPEVVRPPQWATVFVPALTTGSVAFIGLATGQKYLIWTGLLVSLGAVVTPFVTYWANIRAARRRDERRRRRYVARLAVVAADVRAAGDAVRAALDDAHPAPDRFDAWAASDRLWERRATDDDFAAVAAGTGRIPSGLALTVAATTADADPHPDLEAEARAVTAAATALGGAPLVVPLREAGVVGLEGPWAAVAGLARAMLLEALVCCGPDELTLLVAAPESHAGDWAWAAELPHALRWTRPGDGAPVAGVATDPAAFAAALARAVTPRIRLRDESRTTAREAGLPLLLVVVADYRPLSVLEGVPLLREVLADAVTLGVTVLAAARPGVTGPAESTVLLTLDAHGRGVLRPVRSPEPETPFTPNLVPAKAAGAIAARIHGQWPVTDLSFAGERGDEPLLDLIGARAALAGPPGWAWPPPAGLLAATIGVLADGTRLVLDLKESGQGGVGPHGLLIGATGSGKSELLRSLVASLALTHSPDWLRVAFVDFKGGAAFDALTGLPHCAGLVTNLDDPALVARVRAALEGELVARQRRLAAAGPDIGDIRAYWERSGAQEPLPYLLIVIDEFAELMEADPGFSDTLVSIARLGRSVGMHLLLAGQRLESGRLRGLEGHLGYRIALRTFTPEDSVAVIGSRVAADLPIVPGHGFVRAGGTLQRFRAAQVFQAQDPGGPADLARIVAWTRPLPAAPKLWLEPLPDPRRMEYLRLDDPRLDADSPAAGNGLPVAVGLLDDPLRRAQRPLTVDVAAGGGHLAVVGAPQTGKSALLATEILRAARAHPAYQLQYLVLDFGGGALSPVRGLPNVAAYATPVDARRVGRIVAEIPIQLDRRARDGRRGDIVLVIDNFAVFAARCPEHLPVIDRLLAEGAAHGLHLHVSTPRWNDLGLRRLDAVGERFELRLHDPAESRHGRARGALLAAAGPGRALAPGGLVAQFAAPVLAGATPSGPQALAETVDRVGADLAARHDGARAEPLLLLDDLTPDRFAAAERTSPAAGALVLGIDEAAFSPVPFRPGKDGHLLYLGDQHTARTRSLARLLTLAHDGDLADAYVVDLRGGLLAAIPKPEGAARTPADVGSLARKVQDRLDPRLNGGGDDRPVLLVVDDYDLVLALAGARNGPLDSLAPLLRMGRELRFSLVLNQTVPTSMRETLTARAVEAEAAQVVFSAALRTEAPPGATGRLLPPAVARLVRPGEREALIQTLPPRRPEA